MKIYGKHKEITSRYFEVEYREYREDGTLKQIGTEDFSIERWNKQVHMRFIYTWDGKRRNAGGHRWFDYQRSVFTDDPKALKKIARAHYTDAALVEVRTK